MIAMDKIKALVVDDKKIIGDLFEFTLGYKGHDITWVANPNDALEKIKNENFDIAFVDIVMPDKDGIAVLREIRSINPGLPVVMMSGYSVLEKRIQSKDLGAIECMKKPFEMDDVRRVVKQAIGKDI